MDVHAIYPAIGQRRVSSGYGWQTLERMRARSRRRNARSVAPQMAVAAVRQLVTFRPDNHPALPPNQVCTPQTGPQRRFARRLDPASHPPPAEGYLSAGRVAISPVFTTDRRHPGVHRW